MIDENFNIEDSDFEKLNYTASKLASIINKELEELSVDFLLDLTFVDRPYFNFDKVYCYEDVFIAKINPEQPIGFESTPISSGEASRHMAILGSCAFAANSTNKFYYLANRARMRSNFDNIKNIGFRPVKPLYILASVLGIDKKQHLSATSLVNSDGETIFEFKVSYQTFDKNLFQRIFKDHHKNTQKNLSNPYRDTFSYINIEIKDDKLTAILPKFSSSVCAGHFDSYPILPVGILAHMTINTLKFFLNRITNDPNLFYCLVSANMDVYKPTSINQESKLEIFYKGNKGNEYCFYWQLRDLSDKILNLMHISFAVTYKIVSIT